MLENFLTVAGQVLVLFGLIAMGFILTKKGMLTENGAKVCTDIALYLAVPAVIIRSFVSMEYNAATLKTLLFSCAVCLLIHIAYIIVGVLVFSSRDDSRQRVMRFAAIFSNAGFMALPLQEALLGEQGVFFGATYVVIFNIVAWSYGVILMSGEKKQLSVKKMLFTPGLIGTAIGVLFFAISLPVPDIIKTTGISLINHTANLNTPIPMIVIGYYLATSDFKKALKDKGCYLNLAMRLILMPLATLGVLYACAMRGTMLVSLTVAASAPTAAMTTMFAAKYGRDTELSVNIVSLSTLLSIITMPIIVAIAQYIA